MHHPLIPPPIMEVTSQSYALKIYMVESKEGAIACMLLALVFLGTWPAIFTFLERRGRLPQHTYLDFSITNLFSALVIAFTVGEIGSSSSDEPNFINQLVQDNWPSVLFALASGLVLSLGNLGTQYALAFVGLSVTEVITASMTVILGTTVNYYLDDKINKAEILFPGVGCFLIAVLLGSAVHASNAADIRSCALTFCCILGFCCTLVLQISVGEETIIKHFRINAVFEEACQTSDVEGASDSISTDSTRVQTGDLLVELEKKRAIKVFGKSTMTGLVITLLSGISLSLFSPLFNIATNDQTQSLKEGVPHLTVYTAFFYFSISGFIIAIILNITFLYYPVLGLPRSSFKAYAGDWNGRTWALSAGFLCGFGNGLQFIGGEAAGYAAADAVQALPLVSTFWAITLLGEYQRSSRRTYSLLGAMLFMFVVAVGLLIASAGNRTQTEVSFQ